VRYSLSVIYARGEVKTNRYIGRLARGVTRGVIYRYTRVGGN